MHQQADDSISRHLALRTWWKGAPTPVVEALILACVARGITRPEQITRLANDVGGTATSAKAERLLARKGDRHLWKSRLNGDLILTLRGLKSLETRQRLRVVR